MISERNAERNNRAQANTTTYGTASRSLTVVKKDLVEEKFRNLGMRLKSSKYRAKARDYGAWTSGSQAGNNVNLSRPVGSSNETRMISGY